MGQVQAGAKIGQTFAEDNNQIKSKYGRNEWTDRDSLCFSYLLVKKRSVRNDFNNMNR